MLPLELFYEILSYCDEDTLLVMTNVDLDLKPEISNLFDKMAKSYWNNYWNIKNWQEEIKDLEGEWEEGYWEEEINEILNNM